MTDNEFLIDLLVKMEKYSMLTAIKTQIQKLGLVCRTSSDGKDLIRKESAIKIIQDSMDELNQTENTVYIAADTEEITKSEAISELTDQLDAFKQICPKNTKAIRSLELAIDELKAHEMCEL